MCNLETLSLTTTKFELTSWEGEAVSSLISLGEGKIYFFALALKLNAPVIGEEELGEERKFPTNKWPLIVRLIRDFRFPAKKQIANTISRQKRVMQ